MGSCALNPDVIHRIVNLELQLHPHAEPIDIYKLLYQALFGPSHIVRDYARLCLNINSELWQMEHTYQPLIQDLETYSRISLSHFRPGMELDKRQQAIECLAQWVLDSCTTYENESMAFLECWNLHLPYFKESLAADNAKWDYAGSLATKAQIPSHSKLYHAKHHPHYRLVSMKLTHHYNRFMELTK